jgi:hypothetical protein
MTAVDDIINQLPIGTIAARLGVDEATARSAVEAAVPAITSGLTANSQSAGGAQSLTEALQQHTGAGATTDVNAVDESDGAKIVQHIFGAQQPDVVQRLGAAPGPAGSAVFAKLLPLLAPIVLAQVAQHVGAGQASSATSSSSGGGALGSVLGSILGGSGASKGIEDVLGGLLGGGRK